MKKLTALILAALLALLALSTLTALAAPLTDRDVVKRLQQALNAAGYDCGTPDGIAGKKTAAAVMAWQAANGMEETGRIDEVLRAMELRPDDGEAAAGTGPLDLSAFRGNDALYRVDDSEDGTNAFIESQLKAKDRSFIHKYDSAKYYSTTDFDVIAVNYNKTGGWPCFRLWIDYYADNGYLGIESATFAINGKDYTFTDLVDYDSMAEDTYVEDRLIKFGFGNLQFLEDLKALLCDVVDPEQPVKSATGKLILHGKEDIEAELGAGFFQDYLNICCAWLELNGPDYLARIDETPMVVE